MRSSCAPSHCRRPATGRPPSHAPRRLLGITRIYYLTGAAVAELTTEVRNRSPITLLPPAPCRGAVVTHSRSWASRRTRRMQAGTAPPRVSQRWSLRCFRGPTTWRSSSACQHEPAGHRRGGGALAPQGDVRDRPAPGLQLGSPQAATGRGEAEGRRGLTPRPRWIGLRAALTTDELAQPIGSALQRADDDVFAWLSRCSRLPQPRTPPTPPPAPTSPRRRKRDVHAPRQTCSG